MVDLEGQNLPVDLNDPNSGEKKKTSVEILRMDRMETPPSGSSSARPGARLNTDEAIAVNEAMRLQAAKPSAEASSNPKPTV